MNKGNMSRRGFLARAVTGLTVGAGLPLWYANEIVADAQDKKAKTPQANDRIVMGAIGTGTNRFRVAPGAALRGERGVAIMNDAMRTPGVQMIAVADVDAVNKDFGANIVGRACQKFEDFRQLLALRDIDAVTIGTPDHWHALIAIAAMKAGKDVYCEKPLTLTLEEGKALVRVQRETGKVLQTGSQQRSDARFRLACEMVRNNRIGRVRQVTTLIGSNPVGGPFNPEPVPEGLNWDFWQGPTGETPFIKQRCHYEFRWWYEYSGGKMTDWGAAPQRHRPVGPRHGQQRPHRHHRHGHSPTHGQSVVQLPSAVRGELCLWQRAQRRRRDPSPLPQRAGRRLDASEQRHPVRR